MTYIVNESCIKCKYMDCVEVCPVDCFYEGENMLVIHPDECIDCGVCEPECPVDAIKPDTEPGLEKWLEINTKYAQVWPNITVKREPPPDAKEWEGKPDKAKLLSPNPGTGDWGWTAQCRCVHGQSTSKTAGGLILVQAEGGRQVADLASARCSSVWPNW